jgi:hypothetical protein
MESPLLRKIMLSLGTLPGVRSFRNNVGMGWAGKLVSNVNGRVTLDRARPLHAGLVKGSGDLIGWKSVKVTPDMVGMTLAVFVSVEVKDGPKGKTSEAQDNWRDVVNGFGGIAIIARSESEALAQLETLPPGC